MITPYCVWFIPALLHSTINPICPFGLKMIDEVTWVYYGKSQNIEKIDQVR